MLVCDKKALADRLSKDVAVGLRKPDIIERGIERLPLYDSIGSVNIDVSNTNAAEVAARIAESVNR